jgi:hypothetical protein
MVKRCWQQAAGCSRTAGMVEATSLNRPA